MLKYNNVTSCKLLKRPSATIKSPYVGDILINNDQSLAHCPSLGLGNILLPNSECIASESTNKKNKTKYTIEAVKDNNTWVGNVQLHANRIVKQLLENSIIIPNIKKITPEYKMEDSRIDFMVEDYSEIKHYIEVKSVHIKQNNAAVFPVGYKKNKTASVSERANKHVAHLTQLASNNKKSYIIFVVQRDDCTHFEPFKENDHVFYKLLHTAQESGVIIKAIQCSVNTCGITFNKELPVII